MAGGKQSRNALSRGALVRSRWRAGESSPGPLCVSSIRSYDDAGTLSKDTDMDGSGRHHGRGRRGLGRRLLREVVATGLMVGLAGLRLGALTQER